MTQCTLALTYQVELVMHAVTKVRFSGRPGGLASGTGRPAPGLPSRRWPRLEPGITGATGRAVMAASRTGGGCTAGGAGAAVMTGRPGVRVRAVNGLGESHRFGCPRGDTHLTYMINIVLTKEFTLAAAGAR